MAQPRPGRLTALLIAAPCIAVTIAGLATLTSAAAAAPCIHQRVGTQSDDFLRGTDGSDSLRGKRGDDALSGLQGADCLDGDQSGDTIRGGFGKDRIRGGAGGDMIFAADGFRDVVRCGKGRDRVVADSHDVLGQCEGVTYPGGSSGGGTGAGGTGGTGTGGGPGACAPALDLLVAPGCQVIHEDTGASTDAVALWGEVGCASASRYQGVTSGGDPHPTATGVPQANDAFRSLTVKDGDDFYGERCELGRNEHRFGEDGGKGTFAVYREGEHRLTFLSLRMPNSFPLATSHWQTVMQMKQSQPSAAGGGGPMLEVQADNGRFYLSNDWNDLWSTPASSGNWIRFAFDVVYSQDPSVGSVTMYVDLNGDGDAADPAERSPTFHVSTLKRETSGGWAGDGIAPGESIPSHLRTGMYHDSAINCPNGCSIAVDNVEVLNAG